MRRTVPVVNSCRDVGAHLNATKNRKVGTTLTERLWKTAGAAEKLRYIKALYERKAAVVRAKLLPMGLFGCEVAPINEAAMRTLRSSIVNVLTFTTSKRSSDLVFAAASKGDDTDPDIEVVARRVTALRRSMVKNKEVEKMSDEIMNKYGEQEELGIYKSQEELKFKTLAGDVGTPERMRLRRQCNPQGPVRLLLESVQLQAAVIDKEYQIRQWNQPPIGIKKAPYQQLKTLTKQMCKRNRTCNAINTRDETMDLKEIDDHATKADTDKLDKDDLWLLNVVRTGSMWTKATAYWAG